MKIRETRIQALADSLLDVGDFIENNIFGLTDDEKENLVTELYELTKKIRNIEKYDEEKNNDYENDMKLMAWRGK